MFLCFLTLSILSVGDATLPGLDDIPSDLIFQNKCMKDYGCFYTGPPFYHKSYRPIVLTPFDDLPTKFLLFTPKNPDTEEELEAAEDSIKNSSFDRNLPVRVLIHGFMTNLEKDDVFYQTKDAFLKMDDCNVIIVDWTRSNKPPYEQAIANARVIGAQLARLLKLLMKLTAVRAEDIHLIGHSLGAHVAGWTGERIESLCRISGLDPAGPYFQYAPKEVRLDTTDALFVDVIHTNGAENMKDGFGIYDPIGHIDFYPSSGRHQPGCMHSPQNEDSVGDAANITRQFILNACDHSRANNLYLESVDDSKCRFLATWCNNYDDFEKGDCSSHSTHSEMGFHAKRRRTPKKSKLFLRTHSSSPFCIKGSV